MDEGNIPATVQLAMWIVGQTILLLIVIIGAAVKFVGRLASVEAKVEASKEHFDTRIKDLRDDHGNLSEQVSGISRAVARLEGRNQGQDQNHLEVRSRGHGDP